MTALLPACPSTHRQVQHVHCCTIDCAGCGIDAWDGYQIHFDSEVALWRSILRDGWTIRSSGKAMCPDCSHRADCVDRGHDWQDWYSMPSNFRLEFRYCDHCGVCEERAIGPGQ